MIKTTKSNTELYGYIEGNQKFNKRNNERNHSQNKGR